MTLFTSLAKGVKEIRKEDYVYISALVLFLIIIGLVFSTTVTFLSSNINKVFSSDKAEIIRALDTEQYTFITKKLNLSVPTFNEDGTVETPAPTAETATTTPEVLDIQSLVIKVLNGTKKKGLAATLSEALKADGFTVIKTGNEEEPYATTTLFLLDTKKSYEGVLMTSLRKTYPYAIATTTDKNSGYDVVIIIGQN